MLKLFPFILLQKKRKSKYTILSCFVVIVELREITTFSCLLFVPTLLCHHSQFCTKTQIFPFPLPTDRPSDSKGFPPLQPHELSLNHVTLFTDFTDVAVTVKNKPHAWIGVDVPPAEPPPSLRRRASNSHHSQPFGRCPSFSKKGQQASWKAVRVGI